VTYTRGPRTYGDPETGRRGGPSPYLKDPYAGPPRWRTYGEVYAYRTRKPGALLRIPFVSFHWAYVGQTRDPTRRDLEHRFGGGRYGKPPASWSDREPRRFVLWRMKHAPQWAVNGAEWLFIQLLQPVYNDKMNGANLRRVSRRRAIRAREIRTRTGRTWTPLLTPWHLITWAFWLMVAAGMMLR
jgi:hypothetical protein